MTSLFAVAVACLLGVSATVATAASLQVEPALVDVQAPGAASKVTLRNTGDAPIQVQVRVFRWIQENGTERYEATTDVVASPPALKLEPGKNQTARIVRVAKRPVAGEESYRLIVDELPSSRARSGTVTLLMRHAIPVFFTSKDAGPADVSWRVRVSRGGTTVTADNRGGSRLRISAMTLRDPGGREISFGKGLVGYALAGSTMSWSVAPGSKVALKGTVSVSADGNGRKINAVARAIPGN